MDRRQLGDFPHIGLEVIYKSGHPTEEIVHVSLIADPEEVIPKTVVLATSGTRKKNLLRVTEACSVVILRSYVGWDSRGGGSFGPHQEKAL